MESLEDILLQMFEEEGRVETASFLSRLRKWEVERLMKQVQHGLLENGDYLDGRVMYILHKCGQSIRWRLVIVLIDAIVVSHGSGE